jgi:hypothetical protein
MKLSAQFHNEADSPQRVRAQRTPWLRRCVDSTVRLGAVGNRKIPCLQSKFDSSAVQSVAQLIIVPTELSWLQITERGSCIFLGSCFLSEMLQIYKNDYVDF